MTSQVVDYVTALAVTLTTAGCKATADLKLCRPPMALVSPVVERTFDGLASETGTLKVYLIGAGPGDIADAEALEAMLAIAKPILNPDRAEAVSYLLPNSVDAKPALMLVSTITIT